MDTLVCYALEAPELILYFPVCYFRYFREPLLRLASAQELDLFLRRPAGANNALRIEKIVQDMLKLHAESASTMLRFGTKEQL